MTVETEHLRSDVNATKALCTTCRRGHGMHLALEHAGYNGEELTREQLDNVRRAAYRHDVFNPTHLIRLIVFGHVS